MKQYQKNTNDKDINPNGDDLLGQLFVPKKHISYEIRAKND